LAETITNPTAFFNMNTVQNGKGDLPRNNWGPDWYAGYEAIGWHNNGESIMNRLNSIESRHINPEARSILRQFQVSPAEAPNFLGVLAKSLAAMRAYAGAKHALAHGQLTSRQRRQIALAVAEINGCAYCVLRHSSTDAEADLSGEDIRLARRAAAEDPRDDAMLRFTQAVVLQRGEIRDDDLSAVRLAGFSESEIIEIVANIALNIFTNYLSLIARTEAEFPPGQSDGPSLHTAAKAAGAQA